MKTAIQPHRRRVHPLATVGRRVLTLAALTACCLRPVSAQISVSNAWNLTTDLGLPYVTSGAFERGITINPVSGHTIVVSRSGGQQVVVLDSDTGAELGTMDANAATVTDGTFPLNLIGAADDGNLYLGNLITSSSSSYRLYRYTNESSLPIVVYSGFPGAAGPRWGDTMDVRGSGTNTEILIGSAGTQAAILKPTDENLTNFAAFVIDVSGLSAGAMAKGISFFTNNTFVTKTTADGTLRLVRYDLSAGTGTVVGSWSINSAIAGVKVAVTNIGTEPYYLLAGVRVVNSAITPQALMVYDLSSPTATLLYSNNFAPPLTANANAVGTAWIQGDRIAAVATQNGLQGARIYISTAVVPPTFLTSPASVTIVQGGYATLSGTADGTRPIGYQWLFNGAPLASGATNATLNLTNVTPAQAGAYTLVASNVAGVASSPPATVSVTPTVLSDVLTPLWRLAPGDAFYLANDNNQRGLAYRAQSDHVIVVSRTPTNGVHVLDGATGNYLYSLKWDAGLITGGTFAVNLVAVDEEGIIYVGNLTTSGNTSDFRVYQWFDDNPNGDPILYWQGNPAAGTAQRWGDNLAVRRINADTAILVAARNSNIVSILHPDFGPTTPGDMYPTDGTLGNYGLSVAFGDGDTFWGKASGQSLRQVAYDINTLTTTTLQNLTSYPLMTVMNLDTGAQLLAGVFLETPDNLRLYDMSNLDTRGLLNLDTEFFPTDNANINGTGAVAFGNNRLYALDSNNGITAYEIHPERIPPVLNYGRAGNDLILTWSGTAVLQSKAPITGNWTDVTGAASGFTTNLAAADEVFFQLKK